AIDVVFWEGCYLIATPVERMRNAVQVPVFRVRVPDERAVLIPGDDRPVQLPALVRRNTVPKPRAALEPAPPRLQSMPLAFYIVRLGVVRLKRRIISFSEQASSIFKVRLSNKLPLFVPKSKRSVHLSVAVRPLGEECAVR